MILSVVFVDRIFVWRFVDKFPQAWYTKLWHLEYPWGRRRLRSLLCIYLLQVIFGRRSHRTERTHCWECSHQLLPYQWFRATGIFIGNYGRSSSLYTCWSNLTWTIAGSLTSTKCKWCECPMDELKDPSLTIFIPSPILQSLLFSMV